MYRVRSRLVRDRTALANQLPGMLREHGIAVALGLGDIRRAVSIQVNNENFSGLFCTLLQRQYDRLCGLDAVRLVAGWVMVNHSSEAEMPHRR